MNAVEIEEAVSNLAARPFDAVEFPFAFLLAFGNKETTIKRLRLGSSNKSDLGGVLQTKAPRVRQVKPIVSDGLTVMKTAIRSNYSGPVSGDSWPPQATQAVI